MEMINLFYQSEIIGLIGLMIILISNDYWNYHPVYQVRKRAYIIRQIFCLLGHIYVLYMFILTLIILLLLGG